MWLGFTAVLSFPITHVPIAQCPDNGDHPI
jgi:hypothetical protein